jgi:hypothetical protein
VKHSCCRARRTKELKKKKKEVAPRMRQSTAVASAQEVVRLTHRASGCPRYEVPPSRHAYQNTSTSWEVQATGVTEDRGARLVREGARVVPRSKQPRRSLHPRRRAGRRAGAHRRGKYEPPPARKFPLPRDPLAVNAQRLRGFAIGGKLLVQRGDCSFGSHAQPAKSSG